MTDRTTPDPAVVCWGELLWDYLPGGIHPGGAPFNVGYHLAHHGCRPLLVSALGTDAGGHELLARLARWNLDTAGVRRDGQRPTGAVQATLGPGGDARYEIVRDVAWDDIAPSPAVFAAAAQAEACVFGTLAQRSAANLAWLEQLLGTLPPTAVRVFDVNLRPPYDSPALVARLAQHTTLLKLNAAEAARLHDLGSEVAGREEADARALAARWSLRSVVVTAGARGAGWWHEGTWYWENAHPVRVVDTVGAGDAFLAALLAGVLRRPHSAPAALLAEACRAGEWVASRRGATPEYPTIRPAG